MTVPFSQSLTLDLGTVASPSRSNLLWVWHDHVSGESVKAHYTGLSQLCAFMVTVEDTLYFVWRKL